MNYRVTLVPGDGIGPEIVMVVANAVGQKYGHNFQYDTALAICASTAGRRSYVGGDTKVRLTATASAGRGIRKWTPDHRAERVTGHRRWCRAV